jgi:hypothetical protein
MRAPKLDVRISGSGTIYTFDLLTARAKAWAREHVQVEDYMRWSSGFHCEHRFVGDISEGMMADGLLVA